MKIKLIAMFTLILIVMLPIAIADQLQVQKFSGADGVSEFARSNDELQVEVLAEMESKPILDVARTRLRLYSYDAYDIFQSCSQETETMYRCYYTTSDTLYSGQRDYKIKLMDATLQKTAAEVSKSLIVDFYAPKIINYDVNPKLTKESTVTVDYRVEDYALSEGDTSVCSGIKEIKFLVDNQEVHAEPPIAGQCVRSNDFEFSPQMNGDYVNVNLCLKAYDYLGQSDLASCQEFRIDRSAPNIISLELRDSNGYAISHIKSGQQVTADVYVRVEGNDEDIVLVEADLSELNPNLGKSSPEENYGDLYIWRSKSVTNPENCKATVYSADEIGNTAQKTVNCTLPIDDTAPELLDLRTDMIDLEGNYLIGKNGTIILDIRESGSGLDRQNVFLDLSSLGLNPDAKADVCEKTLADNWECRWFVSPLVSEGDYTISTRPNSRDDLDNPCVGLISSTFKVDNKNPVITEEPQVTIEHLYADYGDNTVRGDVFEIEFTVEGVDSAYANFTSIGGIYGEGTCTGDESRTCTFSQMVDVSGPMMTNLSFSFYDKAGNSVDYDYNLFVFSLLNETSPSYWDYSVDCSPSLIDRSITHLKELPVYCHISLTSSNPDVKPVYTAGPIDLTECTGDIGTYIADIHMMHNGYDSKDPYMVITLANADFSINELNFSCPVHISSHIGESFIQGDEEKQIEFNLEFYNLPMGELIDNLEKDIDWSIQKAMHSDLDLIGEMENYVDWARRLCNAKSLVTSALGVLDGAISTLVLAGSALEAFGLKSESDNVANMRNQICNNAKGPLEQFFIGGNKKEDKGGLFAEKGLAQQTGDIDFWSLLEGFCDIINCKFTKKEGQKGLLVDGAALFGGQGVPAICQNAQNLVSYGIGADYEKIAKLLGRKSGEAQTLVDVKESLIWSTVCFCIPGILYNLNKLREIECRYAVCLAQDVKEQGIPISWCKDEKHYLTCTFIVGEIFSIIPYAALADKVITIIKDIFANPISIVQAVSGCLCGGCTGTILEFSTDPCKVDNTEAGWQYVFCAASKTVAKIGDAIASYEGMEDSHYWSLYDGDNSWCKKAEKLGLDD